MTSTATCTLDGHLVIVDAWAQEGSGKLSPGLATTATYYAYGPAWTAILADPGATPEQTTLQEQLTNAAGSLLAESSSGDPYPAASLDAQQSVAGKVAAVLGGTVGHIG
jgi:hypothetical protein